MELRSFAEQQACKAEALPAFSGLSLLHIRRQIAELLALIGKSEIFDEYTKHDISHIDGMLNLASELVIPKGTQDRMSPTDWLLIVLSTYFHDLGMLVTKHEFQARQSSTFPSFKEQILYSNDDKGKDYRSHVEHLSPEDQERFLYQEFVRANHAKRIWMWITGAVSAALGVSSTIAQTLDELLKPLGSAFRRDLALVCESHHLDDLDDFAKYKVSQPYGMSAAETGNLHYAAVILRTLDLLHIASDRAPSIAFRILNPSNPVSQREWAKQGAVRSIRSQPAKDSDGNINPALPRDTIEVHATFTREDGFFGLTSYLEYAERQLKLSQGWILQAQRQQGSPYEFPWRRIDQSNIEAQGFLQKQFEFTLDQVKILDLLTGHTLYNDTGVVIRELAQNSIDAVRLQFFDRSRSESKAKGTVRIHWNTAKRILTVSDNGTGMTQSIIENNLLKVGASRYQEPRFREEYPDFTPISRFGIGVLSAFMIADDVDIVTVSPQEEQARLLLLRNVHGKYLIRLLNKAADPDARKIGPHGTEIRLKVRASAEIVDVLATARRWIVVPDCRVTVSVDGGPEQVVGYDSPKQALEDILEKQGISLRGTTGRQQRVKVEEVECDGLKLAYALGWSDYFQEWSFLTRRQGERREEGGPRFGTCVEGIRVEDWTPGFGTLHIFATANVTGKSAPKTNVARSGLELTPETEALFKAIYTMYAEHVNREIKSLQEERSFSLTWAVGEARFLADPLLHISNYLEVDDTFSYSHRYIIAKSPDALVDALMGLPFLLIEEGGRRTATSARALAEHGVFWTVDSAFFRSVEAILREIPNNASLKAVADVLGGGKLQLPDGVLFCQQNPPAVIRNAAFREREADEIKVDANQRRIDCRWAKRSAPPMWISPSVDWPPASESLIESLEIRSSVGRRRTAPIAYLAGSASPTLTGVTGNYHLDIVGTTCSNRP